VSLFDEALKTIDPEISPEHLRMMLASHIVNKVELASLIASLESEVDELREQRDLYVGRTVTLRGLMQEAVRDFHGKSVLFSAFFLNAAEGR